MNKFLSLIFLLLCAGCSTINTETEIMRDVFWGQQHKIGMFATQSDSRVIIANVTKGYVCAEPPPETQLTESRSMKLLIEAVIKEEGNGKVEALKTLSQEAKQLYERSHTNQLYRDASYYLCQAHINGTLTNQNIVLFLKLLIAGNTELQQQDKNLEQLDNLIETIQAHDQTAESSYILAQLLLTKWAFASLAEEIPDYYEAELSEQKGMTQAYKEGVGTVISEVKSARKEIQGIQDHLNKSTITAKKPEEKPEGEKEKKEEKQQKKK